MPILQRFDNSRVLMYFDDHPPPHVHVMLRDGRDCTIDLDDLSIKDGWQNEKYAKRWPGLQQTGISCSTNGRGTTHE
ncbi:MAG: DUF4160 domain-containing protein [Alcaligenaceae bacterium]|nr:DUF4160 domain-containing protein [Alcaligenaceae bacterium]